MLTTKVFLLILVSGANNESKMAPIPMQPELSVREQALNCESLSQDLLETWKNDPVISRLNVSLTCVSTVPTDIDH